MKKIITKTCISLALIVSFSVTVSYAENNPVINSIVAVVEDQPLTVFDVNAVLYPKKNFTLEQIKKNQECLQTLNRLILHKLVILEASSQRISVSDNEIDSYTKEIAKRNGLSLNQFKKALNRENRTVTGYKEEIKTEILKSKLIAKMFQEGIAISDKDIENYIAEHPELEESGTKYKLRQILISKTGKNAGKLKKTAAEIEELLKQGEDFSDIATRFSDSPEAAEGGLLGTVAIKNLNSVTKKAIKNLEEGSYSAAVTTPEGIHIFYVEKIFQEDTGQISPELRADIKKTIREQEIAKKVEHFFTVELFNKYTIDRKI